MYEYAIDIHSANHAFKQGHRVMLQVQSTWFPLIDRNPQTWVENIFDSAGVGVSGRDAEDFPVVEIRDVCGSACEVRRFAYTDRR